MDVCTLCGRGVCEGCYEHEVLRYVEHRDEQCCLDDGDDAFETFHEKTWPEFDSKNPEHLKIFLEKHCTCDAVDRRAMLKGEMTEAYICMYCDGEDVPDEEIIPFILEKAGLKSMDEAKEEYMKNKA
jgi:hypothetical protein